MSTTDARLDEAVTCRAGCPGVTAEPDQDGDHVFYVCAVCGYEFGYRRLTAAVDTCSAGVPEDVRRRASIGAPTPLPLMQIGRPT